MKLGKIKEYGKKALPFVIGGVAGAAGVYALARSLAGRTYTLNGILKGAWANASVLASIGAGLAAVIAGLAMGPGKPFGALATIGGAVMLGYGLWTGIQSSFFNGATAGGTAQAVMGQRFAPGRPNFPRTVPAPRAAPSGYAAPQAAPRARVITY